MKVLYDLILGKDRVKGGSTIETSNRTPGW